MTEAELNQLILKDNISYGAIAYQYSKQWPRYQITADEVRSAHYLVRYENQRENLTHEEVKSKVRSALLTELRGTRTIKIDNFVEVVNIDESTEAYAPPSTHDPESALIAKEYFELREKIITDNRTRLPILARMLCDARVLCSTPEALAKSLRKRRTVVENQFAEELASFELLAAGKTLNPNVQESLF